MIRSASTALRAFAVTFGAPLALDAGAAMSFASAIRALTRRRRPPPAALGGIAAVGVYALAVRPWIRNWGATTAERSMPLPGDELIPDAAGQSTHAVTVDAPVEQVWPWLAQLGQDRGGFYSYEWLENLAGCQMTNADAIHPEWQHREVGDMLYLHPAYSQRVARFEPNRALALEGWGSFVVQPTPDGRTRLITRSRTPRGPAGAFEALLVDVPHFVMERRMLLGIKERAERR